MNKPNLRSITGLALALGLSMATSPARGDGPIEAGAVRIAAVSEPLIVPITTTAPTTSAAPAPTTTTTTTAPPATTTTTTAPRQQAAPTPAPEPVPAPAPAAAPGSIDEILQRHFGSAAASARRVAYCESKLDPNARSATNDHGLFQINAVHRGDFERVTGQPWANVYDPEANTTYAKWLYDRQGWQPWACRHAA